MFLIERLTVRSQDLDNIPVTSKKMSDLFKSC